MKITPELLLLIGSTCADWHEILTANPDDECPAKAVDEIRSALRAVANTCNQHFGSRL